jgi:hypothetical protein
VTATAKAEAYNSANSQTSTGNYIPVTLKSVKPLLIANQDASGNRFIVDTATGTAATGMTNKETTLNRGCQPGGGPSTICVPPGATLGKGSLAEHAILGGLG